MDKFVVQTFSPTATPPGRTAKVQGLRTPRNQRNLLKQEFKVNRITGSFGSASKAEVQKS
ncbi:MAG: hypothetical protein QM520_02385 [Gammaproteobacteria bacterium]|nr:hypothetical protein [Gammaproteobacteria bacterium]